MTVARTTGNFVTSSSLASGSTATGSEVDMFGNDTTEGWFFLYLTFTSTVTAGTLDVTLFYGPTTGAEAEQQAPIVGSYAPINGTQSISFGPFQASRFMIGQVANNGTGAAATSITLAYELFEES